MDLPAMEAFVCRAMVGKELPGPLPWVWERTDALPTPPPPEDVRDALERMYRLGLKSVDRGTRSL